MDEPRVRLGAARREPLDRPRVHRKRLVLLALADLDVVERGAVEHERRVERREHRVDRGVVGDVEIGAGRRVNLRAALQQRLRGRRPAGRLPR